MAAFPRVHADPESEGDLLASIRDRLDELARLGEDWDSYGAHPPAATAIDEALRFAAQVLEVYWSTARERALPTSISPLPSGGVELEWRTPDRLLAIDVGPDGEWGYLRRIGAGREARYDESDAIARDALLPLVSEVLLSRHSG
jgi:hypothetical protein